MDPTNVLVALCRVDGHKRTVAIRRAIYEYADILVSVYNDIYESCIKVYYSSYNKPIAYTRHQDIVGFNLYSAFSAEVLNTRIDAMYMPENLLGYRGNVTREQVHDAVVHGQRGIESRNMPRTGIWPKSWSVKYPNSYSQCSIWKSSANTIDTIINDFEANCINDTSHIFFQLLAESI